MAITALATTQPRATAPQVSTGRSGPAHLGTTHLGSTHRARRIGLRALAGSWRLAPRQAHGEHRAFALLARHGHVTAHHARELAGDGEAETGAPEAPRGRGIGLAELLEQLCLLLRRHANAGIDHRQLDPIASIGHLARLQLDLTLFGELAG